MGNRRHVVRVAPNVALFRFLTGFDATVISGVVKFIEPHFDLTKLQLGWAVLAPSFSFPVVVSMIGGLVVGAAQD